MNGLFSFAIKRPILPGAALQPPVEFVIKTNLPYPQLNAVMTKLEGAARTYPGLIAPNVNLQMSQQQVNIHVDRDKAAALGITNKQIDDTLATYLAKGLSAINLNVFSILWVD